MERPSRYLANSSTALEQLRGLIHQHESTPGDSSAHRTRTGGKLWASGDAKCAARSMYWKKRGASGVNRAKVPLLAPPRPSHRLQSGGAGATNQYAGSDGSAFAHRTGPRTVGGVTRQQRAPALMQRMLERIDNVSPDDPDLNELWDSAFSPGHRRSGGKPLDARSF